MQGSLAAYLLSNARQASEVVLHLSRLLVADDLASLACGGQALVLYREQGRCRLSTSTHNTCGLHVCRGAGCMYVCRGHNTRLHTCNLELHAERHVLCSIRQQHSIRSGGRSVVGSISVKASREDISTFSEVQFHKAAGYHAFSTALLWASRAPTNSECIRHTCAAQGSLLHSASATLWHCLPQKKQAEPAALLSQVPLACHPNGWNRLQQVHSVS
jgi:hypothetical protein